MPIGYYRNFLISSSLKNIYNNNNYYKVLLLLGYAIAQFVQAQLYKQKGPGSNPDEVFKMVSIT